MELLDLWEVRAPGIAGRVRRLGILPGGLGVTVFREEDEEDKEIQIEKRLQGLGLGPGIIGSGAYSGSLATYDTMGRGRGPIWRPLWTHSSSRLTPSTTFATPDLGLLAPPLTMVMGNGGNSNASTSGSNGMTPMTLTPLTPVMALPTADVEAQMGLAKVTKPDLDAFLSYASIISEFCRVETMMIKGIV